MSDAGLERLAIRALDDEHIRCERTEQGALRMHAPAPEAIWLMIYSLQLALMIWLDQVKVSGQILVCRRFFIGDYSMMCPDIAYVSPNSNGECAEVEFARPVKLCPNFVVEFCTHPRELRRLRDKMLRWIASGAELGWLIVPQEQCVYVYSPGTEETIIDGEYAIGRGPMEEFMILLAELWCLKCHSETY